MVQDGVVGQMLKGGFSGFSDLFGSEELVAEALRDLMRDEVKARMREELEKSPELKAELKDAVRMYYEAKLHEAYATIKFTKASAKLGTNLMPSELRDELGREVAGLLEKEVATILEKTL